MEFSLSSAQLVFFIWLLTWAPVVAVLTFVLHRRWKAKRRAENKVRMSDRILLSDIKALAKSNSPLLVDAITLHCAQMEQERNSGD